MPYIYLSRPFKETRHEVSFCEPVLIAAIIGTIGGFTSVPIIVIYNLLMKVAKRSTDQG